MRVLAAVLALTMPLVAAHAADRPFYSADKLQRLCTSQDELARARCRGYIVGAADIMHGGHAVCMPPDMTTERLVALVMRQMAISDDESARPAEVEIHKALTDAFPAPPCI